jgi:hypothetical protein
MFGTMNDVLSILYTNKLQHVFSSTDTKQMEVETNGMTYSVLAQLCHKVCIWVAIVCNAAKCSN